MAKRLPKANYIEDPMLAVPLLAEYLNEGKLSLVIGAGISKTLGLPVWWELVKRCMIATKNKDMIKSSKNVNATSSNEMLRGNMEKVENAIRNDKKYLDLVHGCLYDNIEYTDAIIANKLLIALGALLMGSKRGKVTEVMNFNFDDVLEWYLRLHGYAIQIVSKMPTTRKDVDVITYHPHGCLPRYEDVNSRSDFVVLSQRSYDKRIGAGNEQPWIREFRNMLERKIAIFVGLSGEDPIFGTTLEDIKGYISKDGGRWTGFWIFGHSIEGQIKDVPHFTSRNVIPLCMNSYEEIPAFLLKICQEASNTIR